MCRDRRVERRPPPAAAVRGAGPPGLAQAGRNPAGPGSGGLAGSPSSRVASGPLPAAASAALLLRRSTCPSVHCRSAVRCAGGDMLVGSRSLCVAMRECASAPAPRRPARRPSFLAAAPERPASAETLADALRDTYVQSPRLDAERARLRATDELRAPGPGRLAAADPRHRRVPALAWEREDDEAIALVETDGADGHRQSEDNRQHRRLNPARSGRLLAQQSLYAGGETVAGTRRAENQVLSGRARLAGAEQDGAARRRSRPMPVSSGPATCCAMSKENLDRLQRYLGGAQERFRVAELTRTDVSQADSRVAGADGRSRPGRERARGGPGRVRARRRPPPGELEPAEPSAELPALARRGAGAEAPNHPRVLQASYDLEAQRAAGARRRGPAAARGQSRRRAQPPAPAQRQRRPARRRLDRRRDRHPDLPARCRIFARPPVQAERHPAALRPDRRRAHGAPRDRHQLRGAAGRPPRRSPPSTSRSRRAQMALERHARGGAGRCPHRARRAQCRARAVHRPDPPRAGWSSRRWWRATGCAPPSAASAWPGSASARTSYDPAGLLPARSATAGSASASIRVPASHRPAKLARHSRKSSGNRRRGRGRQRIETVAIEDAVWPDRIGLLPARVSGYAVAQRLASLVVPAPARYGAG